MRRLIFLLVLIISLANLSAAQDWPMWRNDVRRSGETDAAVPNSLDLIWSRRLPALQAAFKNPRLQFDRGYEPIVSGKLLFLSSSHNGSVTAYETETGIEKWKFYTEGPVRLAPVVYHGKIYFGSDDGCFYCLGALDGLLNWKFRAVPSRRLVLGNDHLISMWPIRGGAVVQDDRVYFTAGIWPFEGTFVYSLDAETGAVVWKNDRCGFLYGQHPHNAEAFGGVSPQGYLLINDDELVVPCGTAFPAHFDLKTGKLNSFELPKAGRKPGGWFAMLTKEQRRGEVKFDSNLTSDIHEGGKQLGIGTPDLAKQIKAAGQEISFTKKWPSVTGEIHSMVVADNKLFVSTVDGTVSCFGTSGNKAPKLHTTNVFANRQQDEWTKRATEIIKTAGIQDGFAVVLGVENGRLVEELILLTNFRLIVVSPNSAGLHELRIKWDRAGWLGTRVSIHVGEPEEFEFPPYLANLIVSTKSSEINLKRFLVSNLHRLLRPFGGVACLLAAGDVPEEEQKYFDFQKLQKVQLQFKLNMTIVRRVGALPGSKDYTGTWKSPDALVKAPVGILWYDDSVVHFKRSPQPHFVNGVMITRPKEWSDKRTKQDSAYKRPFSLAPPTYLDIYTGRMISKNDSVVDVSQLPAGPVEGTQPYHYRPPGGKSYDIPDAGQRVNLLTGETEPRTFPKSYGCDGGVDYGFLFTMRSGTAAFYDKSIESGTINLSGPRSGCTNSVIPAGGVLNVPNFIAGCTCGYSLPSALTLVAMPETHEQWMAWGKGSYENIQRIGLNLGAPGDRVTSSGTLWLDVPSSGGPSPQVHVAMTPKQPETFFQHSLWVEGGLGWPWVSASGVRGLSKLEIEGLKQGLWTVRLYFLEPDVSAPNRRLFDVLIQGQERLKSLDVFRQAKGNQRGLVSEFSNVSSDGKFTLELKAIKGETILSGIELIAEKLPKGLIPELAEKKIVQLLSK